MTAPSLLAAAPAMPATGNTGAAPAGTAESSPAFASALDDALTGSGTPDRDAARATADDEPAADLDAVPSPAAPVEPGLWALLSVAQPVSVVPSGTPAAESATAPVAAPAATATPPTAAPVAAAPATAPGAGTIPAAPAPETVQPASGPATPAAAVAPASTPLPPPLPAAVAVTSPPPAPSAEPTVTPFSVVVAAAPAAPAATASATATGAVPAPTPAVAADTATPAPGALLGGTTGTTSDGGAATSDGGTGGQGTGSSPTAAATAPVVDPVFTGTVAAPAAPAAPVTAVPTATVPGDEPPVAAQLGRQLAVLTHAPDGSQTMTLVITPDDLGPVTIRATVTNGTLDLTLHGAHELGRHALADALPDLRRDLEGAGLSLNRLEVGADSGGDSSPWARAAQQQLADSQQGQGRPGQPAAGPRSWALTGDHPGTGSAARTSDLSTSSGVDVLA
ncbi:flagellar hook-length control protein FliK [Modestobacter altitudinis]|uniref:flagellar hook-length control protein FliK n=1 Tax=Modestobacter altitudinis TaxID=2213158 RepID=UPI00110CC23D|nr:flagellar hook-length control protein FliK [Modestobacter altitudinis]